MQRQVIDDRDPLVAHWPRHWEEGGEPVCCQDFCDYCGDCLACYHEDCNDGRPHLWVRYLSEPEPEPDANHTQLRLLSGGTYSEEEEQSRLPE